MTDRWWTEVSGPHLAQGDLLENCLVPVFDLNDEDAHEEAVEQIVKRERLIVLSQSCDLEHSKLEFVALCPILTLPEFESFHADFSKKSWEAVRKGRVEGLHLLASPDSPERNLSSLVVDFGLILSLPFPGLTRHANSLGDRWRLQPPFLEHFSQAFARFFMRVGLPSSIPSFR